MARRAFDVGRVDRAMQLSGVSLLFRMSPLQKALRRGALAAVQSPGSASYHKWLTPEEYAAQFGASPDDIARAAAWLQSQGLAVDGPSRTATRLAFHGTIAQVEQALQTEMHHYRVDGVTHFAMSRAPSVPAELADLILGVHGLHDFRAKPPRRNVRPLFALPVAGADGGPSNYPVLAPADFAKIYDVDPLYAAHITGAGQGIAVAEESDFNDADVAAFRTTFGLPSSNAVHVLVPGSGSASVKGPDYLGESDLDVEWAGAIAQDATITCVFTGA